MRATGHPFIGPAQAALLEHLGGVDPRPSTVDEIVAAEVLRPGSRDRARSGVANGLERLLSRALVERDEERSSTGRRRYRYRITPHGEAALRWWRGGPRPDGARD